MDIKYRFFLLVLVLLSFATAAEDSPEEACTAAAELYAEGDVSGALEEAKWCVTLMEQEKQSKVTSFFPDEVEGYTGAQIDSQNAMGFSTTQREYQKGGKYISVNLTGGAADSAMGALSMITQMGFGTGAGKKIRIQRRSAVVINEQGEIQIMVTLKEGGMLIFETRDLNETEAVAFAKAFPVADLDDSRR